MSDAQNADYVSVRVDDLYEVVQAFYGGNLRGIRTREAIDRLNIALYGVTSEVRSRLIERLNDGSEGDV